MQSIEDQWKSIKANQYNSLNIDGARDLDIILTGWALILTGANFKEHQSKSLNLYGNQWKSIKINQAQWKSSKKRWKSWKMHSNANQCLAMQCKAKWYKAKATQCKAMQCKASNAVKQWLAMLNGVWGSLLISRGLEYTMVYPRVHTLDHGTMDQGTMDHGTMDQGIYYGPRYTMENA